MTTIAYKGLTIAYDTLCTMGSLIVNDEVDKHREWKKRHFFFCGAIGDFDKFIENYEADKTIHVLSTAALVVENGRVFYCGCDEDEHGAPFFKCPIELGGPYAIGSGARHAWTAFDMGAQAMQAVNQAKKRDLYTGGRIRTFDVPLPDDE